MLTLVRRLIRWRRFTAVGHAIVMQDSPPKYKAAV
jgi:hypothetical protein